MEWSDRMNSAIEYIESNLDKEIIISDVAERAFCSSFHFQRMFYAIIGITPAEYIRRRRLTLAAAELAVGNTRVVDIALRYGYESPNAFTRAFKNMHGINPREARSLEVKLSVYNRVSFHVEIKGGNDMEYRVVEKPSFEVTGKAMNFTHEKFFREAPKFWKEYVCTKEYQALWGITNGRWGNITGAPLMSVYLPDDKDGKDSLTDIFCIEKSPEMNTEKFDVFRIPPATWAEFHCTYQTSLKMNKFIYGEWLPSSGYERDEQKPDIAAYFPVAFMSTRGMGVRWWIPVVKKK